MGVVLLYDNYVIIKLELSHSLPSIPLPDELSNKCHFQATKYVQCCPQVNYSFQNVYNK